MHSDNLIKGGLELEQEPVKTITKNKEKYYVHEFAGTKITVRKNNPTAECRTLNKNEEHIRKYHRQKKIRFPPWNTYTNKQCLRGVIMGTAHRTMEQCSTKELSVTCITENYKEYDSIKYPKAFYIQALKRTLRSKTLTRKQRAILEESIDRIKRIPSRPRRTKKPD